MMNQKWKQIVLQGTLKNQARERRKREKGGKFWENILTSPDERNRRERKR